MTLQEAERRRRQSERDRARHHTDDDNRVLSFAQWCALNGISKATGRRIINAGNGPIITELSPRRIGVTVGNNRRWQASRARG
jgi:hypothetical protein